VDEIQYRGDGDAWIEGVPTRNLTREEWEALPEEKRTAALESQLYVEPEQTLSRAAKPAPNKVHPERTED
jgi:hypothetical protein